MQAHRGTRIRKLEDAHLHRRLKRARLEVSILASQLDVSNSRTSMSNEFARGTSSKFRWTLLLLQYLITTHDLSLLLLTTFEINLRWVQVRLVDSSRHHTFHIMIFIYLSFVSLGVWKCNTIIYLSSITICSYDPAIIVRVYGFLSWAAIRRMNGKISSHLLAPCGQRSTRDCKLKFASALLLFKWQTAVA